MTISRSIGLNLKPCAMWLTRFEPPAHPNGLLVCSSEAAKENSDPVTPGDWPRAWDWAASQAYLQRIDQRDHLRSLSDERVQLDQSIAKTFERLVRERTFYALAVG